MMKRKSKNRKIVTAILAFLVLVVIWVFVMSDDTETTYDVSSPQNATYMIEGREVTLVNGYAESEAAPGSATRFITKYFGNEAKGDLNKDGIEDVAFIITQETGGSGVFFHVVVALGGEEGYTGTNSVFLGDRIAPQSTEIVEGKITVNYATRGKNAPMTTVPNIAISRFFKISDGHLTQFK